MKIASFFETVNALNLVETVEGQMQLATAVGS
jgi:hypothetical protein